MLLDVTRGGRYVEALIMLEIKEGGWWSVTGCRPLFFGGLLQMIRMQRLYCRAGSREYYRARRCWK